MLNTAHRAHQQTSQAAPSAYIQQIRIMDLALFPIMRSIQIHCTLHGHRLWHAVKLLSSSILLDEWYPRSNDPIFSFSFNRGPFNNHIEYNCMIISYRWYKVAWKDCHLCKDGHWHLPYTDSRTRYGFDWCPPCKNIIFKVIIFL
jgi:hypothetical protein